MAVITPNTDVILLKVPLEIDDNNQLTFANATAQYNYFYNLPKKSYDHFTYQRKDNTIRVPDLIDNLYGYNYVMYRNTNHSSKWFYAFIEDIQYVSDQVTALTIKTDVWQTWQFNLTYKPCMIEREHANTDTVGSNTIPESLELGEFVTNGSTVDFGTGNDFCVVVDVTMVANPGENQTINGWFDGGATHDLSPYLNGMPSGVIHILCGMDLPSGEYSDRYESLIEAYDFAGLGDAVVSVYVLPKSLVGEYYSGFNITAHQGSTIKSVSGLAIAKNSFTQTSIGTQTFTKPSTLAGSYTPKNAKLLTYPYCYFNISNNAGSTYSYHYEDFSTSNVSFGIDGAFCPSGSVKAKPLSYKNISGNSYDYSVTGAKFPIGNWVNDSYTNWLTQNAVNMRTQWNTALVQGGADILSGSITAGPLGALGGISATGINMLKLAKEQMLAKTSANMVADQAGGNINSGDLIWAYNRGKFTYLPMSIKPEYARCIDDYFSMFGYATNRVKNPNITGRRNWNYVKTIGCYIEADIPQDDLAEIKSLFDKGVTFWHNPSTFADYSQNNDII